MGLVKISEPMHDNVRVASGALNRSINAQAEHWLRIGMMAELNPELKYGELCRLLIQDEIRAEAQMSEMPQKARA
ncbi:ParD-like family protein [Rhodoferax sp.]|uniref:ParD-like family protein n=1 Tax=Rhodoferax sp. TaxID=50421 RepID=UPI00374D5239